MLSTYYVKLINWFPVIFFVLHRAFFVFGMTCLIFFTNTRKTFKKIKTLNIVVENWLNHFTIIGIDFSEILECTSTVSGSMKRQGWVGFSKYSVTRIAAWKIKGRHLRIVSYHFVSPNGCDRKRTDLIVSSWLIISPENVISSFTLEITRGVKTAFFLFFFVIYFLFFGEIYSSTECGDAVSCIYI